MKNFTSNTEMVFTLFEFTAEYNVCDVIADSFTSHPARKPCRKAPREQDVQSEQMQPPRQSLSFIFCEAHCVLHGEHKGMTGGEREKQTVSPEVKVQMSESCHTNYT